MPAPSTKPRPRIKPAALVPSPLTDWKSAYVTMGTTWSSALVSIASPTTPTVPVIASSGTTTVSCVPSGVTAMGLTRCWYWLPLTSIAENTTDAARVNPEPFRVIAWPGLADALNASAGVPLDAVLVIPVNDRPKALLVPPAVVTVKGPKSAPEGTVTLISPLIR